MNSPLLRIGINLSFLGAAIITSLFVFIFSDSFAIRTAAIAAYFLLIPSFLEVSLLLQGVPFKRGLTYLLTAASVVFWEGIAFFYPVQTKINFVSEDGARSAAIVFFAVLGTSLAATILGALIRRRK